jgi:hypothetical protein
MIDTSYWSALYEYCRGREQRRPGDEVANAGRYEAMYALRAGGRQKGPYFVAQRGTDS